jgi:hypothetical protein
MATFLTVDDLLPFSPGIDRDRAAAMIDDASALAVLVAPCIDDSAFVNVDALKAILRGAILRWDEAGTGAVSSQTVGPFGQTLDTRTDRRGMFWPSEIAQLQLLCAAGGSYTISLAGP